MKGIKGSWIRKAYVTLEDLKKSIDLETTCEDIDKRVQMAWKWLGYILVQPKDYEEPISDKNKRKPRQDEWEDLVLYARNKCKQLDYKYFLKDPDPMSKLNLPEHEQPAYTVGPK